MSQKEKEQGKKEISNKLVSGKAHSPSDPRLFYENYTPLSSSPSQFPEETNFITSEEISGEEIQRLFFESLENQPSKSNNDDELELPGIYDFVKDGVKASDIWYFVRLAPRYFSKQIHDICVQSTEFDEILENHFYEENYAFYIKESGIDPWLIKFGGFKETESNISELTIPVLGFSFPTEDCFLKINTQHSSEKEKGFKIDIPGFSGGRGKRVKRKFENNIEKFTENFQAQIMADVRLRNFHKDNEQIVLLEIERVKSNIFTVPEGDKWYWDIPNPENLYLQDIVGTGSASAEKPSVGIGIEKGNWADFELKLSSKLAAAFPSISFPQASSLSLSIRSKSLTSIRIDLHYVAGKYYDVKGPNEDSLRMYVEERVS